MILITGTTKKGPPTFWKPLFWQPDRKLTHHCVHGAALTAEISTYVAGGLTEFDLDLAKAVDSICSWEDGPDVSHVPEVHMKDSL